MANLRQFYTPRHNITIGSSVKLDENEAEHIRKSLRMEVGDKFVLFNGENKYEARLTMVNKDNVLAEVISRYETQPQEKDQTTLFQSLIRAANFELIVQKATELGVENIIPLETEFSQIQIDAQKATTKLQRWEKIALESSKQSERNTIPQIYRPISFAEIEEKSLFAEFDLVLAAEVPREVTQLIAPIKLVKEFTHEISSAQSLALIIGPEGGFSPQEVKTLKDLGANLVSLGKQVLRAETAAIALLSFVQLVKTEN